jgi:hypothetical protein
MEPTPDATPAQSRRSSESSPASSPTSSPRQQAASRASSSESSPPPPTRSPAPAPLNLAQLPPLSQPSPATNTLLLTNLADPDVFRAENLETIRSLVAQTAPIHTWAPLRSFRRIVVAFFDSDAAAAVRAIWDGESVMGHRLRVYYGSPTPVEARDEHLALPDAGKLFFISPPPSPPSDWEMRLEDAPNTMVHADDLAEALARLHKKRNHSVPFDSAPGGGGVSFDGEPVGAGRARSGSTTLIYMPAEHDADPDLPAIAVEDMTAADKAEDEESTGPRIMAHTARPPVALMQH